MNMALLESSAVEHIGWNHHILSKNNTQERFYLLKKYLPKEVINVLKMIYKKLLDDYETSFYLVSYSQNYMN